MTEKRDIKEEVLKSMGLSKVQREKLEQQCRKLNGR